MRTSGKKLLPVLMILLLLLTGIFPAAAQQPVATEDTEIVPTLPPPPAVQQPAATPEPQQPATAAGMYIGQGLTLTSLRTVVNEAMLADSNGLIPLYAQLWRYDNDGVADYGEHMRDVFVCNNNGQVGLATQGDTGCPPYYVGSSELVYADRRFDMAMMRTGSGTAGGRCATGSPISSTGTGRPTSPRGGTTGCTWTPRRPLRGGWRGWGS